MCLQVPGKVIKIEKKKAVIDYAATIADITPKVGDYVLVVGRFVVDIVPEDNAKEALEHWKKTML
jgi:hydrogenase assembly chaperone HypC/HupF